MWRIFFKRFGYRVACTLDCDGEIRYRFMKETPFGLRCGAICRDWSVILNDDGTTSGKSYVKRWKEM